MKGTVLTIGKFDGVHAGHAVLLGQVVSLAAERGLEPAVMTFHPHPVCVIAPGHAPRPLLSLDERCARIRGLGIEEIFVLPFTLEISRLSPEQFISQYICERMQARVVIVGRNFRFGYKQAGDPEVLAELGKRYGFETRLVEAVKLRGLIVSASEIRRRIELGEVSLAACLLGRPYAIAGEVVSGRGIGSRQTVPTLNLQTSAEVLPRDGVYITRTYDLDAERTWNSITNIGMRPTFQGQAGRDQAGDGAARTIETFLLDFLEGSSPRHIRVELLHRIRDERKFETPEALKAQILRDVERTRTYFHRVARWVRTALP